MRRMPACCRYRTTAAASAVAPSRCARDRRPVVGRPSGRRQRPRRIAGRSDDAAESKTLRCLDVGVQAGILWRRKLRPSVRHRTRRATKASRQASCCSCRNTCPSRPRARTPPCSARANMTPTDLRTRQRHFRSARCAHGRCRAMHRYRRAASLCANSAKTRTQVGTFC